MTLVITIYYLRNKHFLEVSGIANSWLTSHLSNRIQYYEVCDYMSDLLQVTCSVKGSCNWTIIAYFIY